MSVTVNSNASGQNTGATGPAGPAGPSGPAGPTFVSKTGVIASGSFAGSPKKASVTFATPYADALYGVVVSGIDPRNVTYESKTAAGFVINLNANTAPANEVSFFTAPIGETT
jgi:hypothetical protein